MSLHYINKNITTINKGVIAHGVNCQGKMGSGVAYAIRKKWPVVFDRYVEFVNANKFDGKESSNLLGKFQPVQVEEQVVVANCFTQVFYGRGEIHAVPKAIEECLRKVLDFAHQCEFDTYIPKIGAGLGGLDWEEEVEPIVKKLADENVNVDIYVCLYGE